MSKAKVNVVNAFVDLLKTEAYNPEYET